MEIDGTNSQLSAWALSLAEPERDSKRKVSF